MRGCIWISLFLLTALILRTPTVCLSSEPTDAAPAAVEPRAMVEQVLVHLEFWEISRTEMAARGLDIKKHDAAVRQILADQRAVANGERELDAAAAGQRMTDLQASLDALQKARVVKHVAEPTIVTVCGRPVHFRNGLETKDELGKLGFKGTEWHCDVEKREDGRIGLTSHGRVDNQTFQARVALHSGQLGVASRQIVVKDGDGSAGNNRAGEEFEYLMLLRPEVVGIVDMPAVLAPTKNSPVAALPPITQAPMPRRQDNRIAASLPKDQGQEVVVNTQVWEVSWTRLNQVGFDAFCTAGIWIPCVEMLKPDAPPDAIYPFLETLHDDLLAQCIAEHELTIPDGRLGRVKAGAEFLTTALLREEKARSQTTFLGTEGTYEVDLKEDHTVTVEFNLTVNQLHDEIKTTQGLVVPPRIGKTVIASALTLELDVPATLHQKLIRKRRSVHFNPHNENEKAVVAEDEEIALLIVMRAELAEAKTANTR